MRRLSVIFLIIIFAPFILVGGFICIMYAYGIFHSKVHKRTWYCKELKSNISICESNHQDIIVINNTDSIFCHKNNGYYLGTEIYFSPLGSDSVYIDDIDKTVIKIKNKKFKIIKMNYDNGYSLLGTNPTKKNYIAIIGTCKQYQFSSEKNGKFIEMLPLKEN
jgi:hypothetical protein